MLDTTTLFMALVPVLLAGLIAHIANTRIHKTSAALRWWGRGMMAEVLGVLAIVAYQAMPLWLAVLIGTLGLVGGQFMILHGMGLFARRPVPLAFYASTGVFSLAGMGWFTFADDSVTGRYVVIALALIAGAVLILHRLLIAARRVGAASVSVLFGVVATAALVLAWSMLAVLFGPETGAGAPEQALQLTALASIALAALAIFGFVLLTSGEAQAKLSRLALTDQLTGIANRRGFEADFERRRKAGRGRSRLALVLLDIDRFKDVNDTHGHEAGDLVLETLAGRLSGALRQGDFVARMGGEEFVVLLHAETREEGAQIAARVREAACGPVRLPDGESVDLTVSAGLSVSDGKLPDAGALYRQADRALYQAKHEGRNRLCVFEGEDVKVAAG